MQGRPSDLVPEGYLALRAMMLDQNVSVARAVQRTPGWNQLLIATNVTVWTGTCETRRTPKAGKSADF